MGQDITILFRRLLCQIWQGETVPQAIQDLYELCDRGLDRRSPTVRELAATLRSLTTSQNGTTHFILIDGIDELEPSALSDLVEELKTLITSDNNNIRILLASRNQANIETDIRSTGPWRFLPVDTVSVQKDIRRFVQSEIDRHGPLKKRKAIHDAILERVADQSDGM